MTYKLCIEASTIDGRVSGRYRSITRPCLFRNAAICVLFQVREVRRLFFHPRDINSIVFIQEIGLADADAMDACMHACIQMYICI